MYLQSLGCTRLIIRTRHRTRVREEFTVMYSKYMHTRFIVLFLLSFQPYDATFLSQARDISVTFYERLFQVCNKQKNLRYNNFD